MIEKEKQLKEKPPKSIPISTFIPFRLVIPMLLRGSDGYISALLHETFHAFQGEYAPGRLEAAERSVQRMANSYPWDDEAFEAAWQTELNLLVDALEAETDAEAVERAGQFLEERSRRRSEANLNSDLIEFEQHREWLEGTARYIELLGWREGAESGEYTPLPDTHTLSDFRGYESFSNRWKQELDQTTRMTGSHGDGRFYYSGMAQAFLLDRLSSEWKTRAFEQDIFLETLLSEALQTR